jgi:hypothetical protein
VTLPYSSAAQAYSVFTHAEEEFDVGFGDFSSSSPDAFAPKISPVSVEAEVKSSPEATHETCNVGHAPPSLTEVSTSNILPPAQALQGGTQQTSADPQQGSQANDEFGDFDAPGAFSVAPLPCLLASEAALKPGANHPDLPQVAEPSQAETNLPDLNEFDFPPPRPLSPAVGSNLDSCTAADTQNPTHPRMPDNFGSGALPPQNLPDHVLPDDDEFGDFDAPIAVPRETHRSSPSPASAEPAVDLARGNEPGPDVDPARGNEPGPDVDFDDFGDFDSGAYAMASAPNLAPNPVAYSIATNGACPPAPIPPKTEVTRDQLVPFDEDDFGDFDSVMDNRSSHTAPSMTPLSGVGAPLITSSPTSASFPAGVDVADDDWGEFGEDTGHVKFEPAPVAHRPFAAAPPLGVASSASGMVSDPCSDHGARQLWRLRGAPFIAAASALLASLDLLPTPAVLGTLQPTSDTYISPSMLLALSQGRTGLVRDHAANPREREASKAESEGAGSASGPLCMSCGEALGRAEALACRNCGWPAHAARPHLPGSGLSVNLPENSHEGKREVRKTPRFGAFRGSHTQRQLLAALQVCVGVSARVSASCLSTRPALSTSCLITSAKVPPAIAALACSDRCPPAHLDRFGFQNPIASARHHAFVH